MTRSLSSRARSFVLCAMTSDDVHIRRGTITEFTAAGGTVRLSVSALGDAISLDVRDTGPGIPADKLEAVFEPFVQSGASQAQASRGTGLGLSISRGLARAMGGDLTLASVLGEGSTFTLTLPRGSLR